MDLLRELTKEVPDSGRIWSECAYCYEEAWEARDIKHSPDCPWYRAVKWLKAVTEEESIMK